MNNKYQKKCEIDTLNKTSQKSYLLIQIAFFYSLVKKTIYYSDI